MAQNLKVGDKVKVIAGGNKGSEGKITSIDRKNNRAIVEGLNVRERHYAERYTGKGASRSIQLGIDLSNLKKEGK